MTLMLPPQHLDVNRQIDIALKLHGYTKAEEIEPRAGCRRFKLS